MKNEMTTLTFLEKENETINIVTHIYCGPESDSFSISKENLVDLLSDSQKAILLDKLSTVIDKLECI